MTDDDDYHFHRMIELQIKRDARRLKRRTTKMVLDNAGVRNLKAVTSSDGKVDSRTRKKPGKR